MPGANQSVVTIPKPMYEEILAIVKADSAQYSSPTDFVKNALREQISRARRDLLTRQQLDQA